MKREDFIKIRTNIKIEISVSWNSEKNGLKIRKGVSRGLSSVLSR